MTALRVVEGPPGAPWNRPLRGRLDVLTVESELLAGNALGDPARRPLYVYVPPGLDESAAHSSVYVIQGMTGQLDMWLNRMPFERTVVERVDDLFEDDDVPRGVVVFVDAWTSFGGSQFVNSRGTGPYMDYLCDEVVPFVDARYPTSPDRDHRGLTGKSSGGYGAMVVPMLRPDVFGALASHAGDALFELCYMRDFGPSARTLRDEFDGSPDAWRKQFLAADRFEPRFSHEMLNTYAMALCYSPSDERPGYPDLPFDVDTGRLDDGVWQRWLEWDPVRMAPNRLDALRSMRRIYLDSGKADEYFLDLGAQAFARELDRAGIDHTLDLFEGTHAGLQHRYPGALRALLGALA